MSYYRGGSGTPLVLIHGFSANWRCWQPVIPALEEHHDVIAINLAGHAEGKPLDPGVPASVDALVDAAARELDELGVGRAHLVGNSLGGWVALALGARSRGLSVVALSPAGGWEHTDGDGALTPEMRRLKGYFMRNYRLLRLLGARGEDLVRRPRFRAFAYRDVSSRAAEIPASLAVDLFRSASNCDIYLPFMSYVEENGFPQELGPIDSPVRIAWGTRDRIIPKSRYSARFGRLVPDAEWVDLDGLGHVPMLDGAAVTVQTILEVTERVDAGERTEAAGAAAP
jgi:pimeloyl-ACP methyl ester carboxylesterase